MIKTFLNQAGIIAAFTKVFCGTGDGSVVDLTEATDLSDYYTKTEVDDLIPAATTIINNLTSTSTTSALSANQGRVLNNKIANIGALQISTGSGSSTLTVSPGFTPYVFIGFQMSSSTNFQKCHIAIRSVGRGISLATSGNSTIVVSWTTSSVTVTTGNSNTTYYVVLGL